MPSPPTLLSALRKPIGRAHYREYSFADWTQAPLRGCGGWLTSLTSTQLFGNSINCGGTWSTSQTPLAER